VTRPQLQNAVWIAGVRDALLQYFAAHARALPWRCTADPYAILISEVMLQQTRVAAVVPYYERWMRRFPDLASVADTPLDAVLQAWQGLGYYARARNLHSAARIMREHHNGTVPSDYTALRALPGVGDYTAGAVASIAYGVRRPAIDGNVRRVVVRLLDDSAATPARVRALTEALLPEERPGDLNQALMELGATICTPRQPQCHSCPVERFCAARAAGTQLDQPRRRRKAAIPSFKLATAVIRAPGGSVLLTRRPATGLLARMWCLPAREVHAADDARAAVIEIARWLLDGATIAEPLELGCVDHTFSHRRERYLCWIVEVGHTPRYLPSDTAWVGADLKEYAVPTAQRRIMALLTKE
jgi:A/G-specific adenine glycosylase